MNNTSAMNNMTSANNQTSANNAASGNNQTAANNMTSANNQTSNNTTSPNPPPEPNGVIEEADLRAFCQASRDCDPDTFMLTYASLDECVMFQQAEIAELKAYYGEGCSVATEAYVEESMLASVCVDGDLELPDEVYEMLYAEFRSELGPCSNAGGVQIEEGLATSFCQALLDCEADSYEDFSACKNTTWFYSNQYLGRLESEEGSECANAYLALLEDSIGSYTCEGGEFVEGMVDPVLVADFENKCQRTR